MKEIKAKGVRRFCKAMLKRVRLGKAALRVIPSDGKAGRCKLWSLGVDTGNSVRIVRDGFVGQSSALLWGKRKTGIKATPMVKKAVA